MSLKGLEDASHLCKAIRDAVDSFRVQAMAQNTQHANDVLEANSQFLGKVDESMVGYSQEGDIN